MTGILNGASKAEEWAGKAEQAPLLSHDEEQGTRKRAIKCSTHTLIAGCYGALNVLSTVGIVMANKTVMYSYGFNFPVALTLCHSVFTALGMQAMAAAGLFERKPLPVVRVLPVAIAYVCFIVFNNLSLKFNTVGFYQLMKIAITPVVLGIEATFYNKFPSGPALGATGVLLLGITLATITDKQVASNPLGVVVGLLATVASALYQVWAGSKQKELQVNANQLVHQASPHAVALLSVLVPLMEPTGLWGPRSEFGGPPPGSLLGYTYSAGALAAIVVSSALGLLVTLSAFLVIGATSPLTYNIVGHIKTVLIMAGGITLFGDELSPVKGLGLAMAMGGIVWYTLLPRTQSTREPRPKAEQANGKA